MRTYQHRVSRLLQRTAGVLAGAVVMAAGASLIAGTPAMAGTVPPGTETVATGPARSLGEPAAAQDSAVSAVVATTFSAKGAQADVWTQPAGSTTWQQAGPLLPAGFGSSYDAAAASGPNGPLLVVAGTAPPSQQCITNGSVAIADVTAQGTLGTPRLVNDQRGTGSFDDRPTVAVGQDGTVWVAWSQGPNADACQDVGNGDHIEVAVSHDGGQTFSAPVTMPGDGGHSAFGVRLAPLANGQVAVSWTETLGAVDQAVLVSVLGAGGAPQQPTVALSGDGAPLVLPGASFYDFPAGDLIVLPDGQVMVAAPFWVANQSVIMTAIGTPGSGSWQQAEVAAPAGADLLLPAIGVRSADSVRLVCAVHTRVGDHLGYDWTDISTGGQGPSVSSAGLTALTPAPAGPGFYEIGEELSFASTTQGGLLTTVVVAGKSGATLETVTFSPPPAPAAPATSSPATPAAAAGSGSAGTPATTGHSTSGLASAASPSSGFPGTAGWLAVAGVACAAAAGAVLFLRRRGPRAARAAAWQPAVARQPGARPYPGGPPYQPGPGGYPQGPRHPQGGPYRETRAYPQARPHQQGVPYPPRRPHQEGEHRPPGRPYQGDGRYPQERRYPEDPVYPQDRRHPNGEPYRGERRYPEGPHYPEDRAAR